MIESQYTQAIHRKLPKSVYKWKIHDSFQGGVADAYYSGKSADLWIEYKYIKKLPKRDSTMIAPDLSELQLNWLTNRHQEGRNVHVIIGSPLGGVVLYCTQWKDGISCADFHAQRQTQQEIADWITSITQGDYHEGSKQKRACK